MKRVTVEELCEFIFVDDDGTVLDPGVDAYVLTPDPKARRRGGPCHIWLVSGGCAGDCPTGLEMESWKEAEEGCDAANAQLGRSPEEADRIILACMAGGAS